MSKVLWLWQKQMLVGGKKRYEMSYEQFGAHRDKLMTFEEQGKGMAFAKSDISTCI